MKVECPSCGQRFEMLGRQTACPNCGQLVERAFQAPLPPRRQPKKKQSSDPYEELEMVSGPTQYASQYEAPSPPRETPAWLPATLLILGTFIGLFLVVYWGSKKL